MKSISAFLLALAFFTPSLKAVPNVVASAVNPTSGHVFYLLGPSDWLQAEAAAVNLGGHLATINDSAEAAWIWNKWGAGRELWIGLNDAAQEGTFVWTSSEPVTFTNWQSGEPNDGVPWGVPSEDYVYMRNLNEGRWNDVANDAWLEYPAHGVVEVVPEPTSTGLAILAGICVCLRKLVWR